MKIRNMLWSLQTGGSCKVSISGCDPKKLNPEDYEILNKKIHKIYTSRNEWGTCSIQGKPVTVHINKEVA